MPWGLPRSLEPSDGIKNGREVQMGSVNKLKGFIQGVAVITHRPEIADKITHRPLALATFFHRSYCRHVITNLVFHF